MCLELIREGVQEPTSHASDVPLRSDCNCHVLAVQRWTTATARGRYILLMLRLRTCTTKAVGRTYDAPPYLSPCCFTLHSWLYDDGFGGSFARFNIDLYYCGGACSLRGDCGQIISRLCEVRITAIKPAVLSSARNGDMYFEYWRLE